ncbi:hypothetical protein [Streptomyces panaciradicis]|nr:hypothetical protein [Streptomyces panaciradicis]
MNDLVPRRSPTDRTLLDAGSHARHSEPMIAAVEPPSLVAKTAKV